MRLFILALISFVLHAQETATPPKTNAIPPAQSKNVILESLQQKNLKRLAEMKQRFGQEQESKVCSIPLLNATPNVKGTMRTITPDETEPNMPKLRMPAPACK